MMVIGKSEGTTPTEKQLAELCERSFLKLWSYPNPFKVDGKELCDLIVVYDDDVLLFFDRESHRLKGDNPNLAVEWPRWRREVIEKQSRTAKGAARYIASGRPIFLDSCQKSPFPIKISENPRVHRIIVAHGAMEACKKHSQSNVSGSLAIAYAPPNSSNFNQPFFLEIDRSDPFHVFDSHNLEIVLNELDTIYDFTNYLNAKIDAINRHKLLTYCGEEDLVAHYLLNYDPKTENHLIGVEPEVDFVHVGEGEYDGFVNSEPYKRRLVANRTSYGWDQLIQTTSQNALNGTLTGNGDPFTGRSAIHFMAKEPRFVRRALSDQITRAVAHFPESDAPIMRNLTLMPSFFEGTAYVFLQLSVREKGDYETEYRPRRSALLEVACAAAKIRWPDLKRVIGIAIDAPKYSPDINSEDLLLAEFEDWNDARIDYYSRLNKELGFFKTGKERRVRISEFPPSPRPASPKHR